LDCGSPIIAIELLRISHNLQYRGSGTRRVLNPTQAGMPVLRHIEINRELMFLLRPPLAPLLL
jgi:hypothetical protein